MYESNDKREKILHNLLHESYCSDEGPLWRTCAFLTNQPFDNQEEIYNPKFRYRNEIAFSFHHSITDATTAFKISSIFLHILNSLIAGNENYKREFDTLMFVDGTEVSSMVAERKAFLSKNPELYSQIEIDLERFDALKPHLEAAYPPDPNEENCTKQFERAMTKVDSKKLLQIFKSQNVTFHGGFCAVVNCCIVEILQEKGISMDSYDIGTYHAINMRKYWPVQMKEILGSTTGSIRTLMATKNDVADHLWDHAREYTKTLHGFLNGTRTLDEDVYFDFESKMGDNTSDFSKVFTNRNPIQMYFSTSNMGNLRQLLPGTGDFVEINDVNRHTSHQNFNISMIFALQTFRERFNFSLTYATKYVHPVMAQKLVDRVVHKLKDLCET